MEQFYRFDRDYNFNYILEYKKSQQLKEKLFYNKNIGSDTLIKHFLKKENKEQSNK